MSVPGSAAGAAAASAPGSAVSGALPLSFRPSVSATSTALAVVTRPRSALAPDASASPARSTIERGQVVVRLVVHRVGEGRLRGERVGAAARVDHGVDRFGPVPDDEHPVDQRVGGPIRDLQLDAAVRLGREREALVRGDRGDRRACRVGVGDVGEDHRGGLRRIGAGRPGGDGDLVTEPRLDVRAVVDAGRLEQVLDDLVDLVVERGFVGEARQPTDQPGEVRLLAGGRLEVDVGVGHGVGRGQGGRSISPAGEEDEVAGDDRDSDEADQGDRGDDEAMHPRISDPAGRRGRRRAAASCRPRSSSSSSASRRTASAAG